MKIIVFGGVGKMGRVAALDLAINWILPIFFFIQDECLVIRQ